MSAGDFDLVVWDFDGVLNANVVDGRFVWSDGLDMDLGIDSIAFSDFVFRSGRMREVISGRKDLPDLLGPWLAEQGHAISAQDFMAYWWEKDARPDPEIIALTGRVTARQVIGTNNEHRRAQYIEHQMGIGRLVERIFASGRMGVAKPDAGFFRQIEDWAGLPPERILLIDDLGKNIASAQNLGWQVFHFTPATRAALPARLGL